MRTSSNTPAGGTTAGANIEWQLADVVDAIAASIDQAQNTLVLKSSVRGMTFAVKQLNLDLEVTVRRTPDGRLLFRTVDPGQAGATVLKLDFTQVLQTQLQGLRRPVDEPIDPRPLGLLPGITPAEIGALGSVAIFSVDDLRRYTQTAAMLAEVGRKTGIADPRLRSWLDLPFLTEVKPPSGPPGGTVVIEGGNLGAASPPGVVLLFQGQPATVTQWSPTRLTAVMPAATGSGALFAVIGNQPTNVLAWEAAVVDLQVRGIRADPAAPSSDRAVTLTADLINLGSAASGPFEVRWTVDGQDTVLPHGPLLPGQPSQESTISRQFNATRPDLAAGPHTVAFTADPTCQVRVANRAACAFTRPLTVSEPLRLLLGDFRRAESFNLLVNRALGPRHLGPGDILSLVSRGLLRPDPRGGAPVPDVVLSWQVTDDGDGVQVFEFLLRDDVRFPSRDRPLTASDVAFTYRQVARYRPDLTIAPGAGRDVVMPCPDPPGFGYEVEADGARVIFRVPPAQAPRLSPGVPPEFWMIGLLSENQYSLSDPAPAGCGPFRVSGAGETPGGLQLVTLDAFPGFWQGAPRLNRIELLVTPDVDQLVRKVRAQQVAGAVLPYSRLLFEELQASGAWVLSRVLAAEPDLPGGCAPPELMRIQLKNVRERDLDASDVNWNAHLWYLA